uniref:Uncharacterized protein n=1 Tax=Aegilops tauschii subsp. strangulata TaxID=200361 RepID=A0A452Y5X1_AEGTS
MWSAECLSILLPWLTPSRVSFYLESMWRRGVLLIESLQIGWTGSRICTCVVKKRIYTCPMSTRFCTFVYFRVPCLYLYVVLLIRHIRTCESD